MVQRTQRSLVAGLALALLASQTSAQGVTTQSGVVGPSGVTGFSQQVRGADGVLYNCRPEIVSRNGAPTRLCRRANIGGVNGTQFGAPGVGALVGLAAIGLALSGDSSSSTD